ncbi:MAG: enoyl-CoA hydratase/isomerase family protein [Thermodesulfobacteriota bacterium]
MHLPETRRLCLSLEHGILLLEINDPPNNCLSLQVLQDISECLDVIRSSNVRAVLIRGKGRNFSKGANLEEVSLLSKELHTDLLHSANRVFLEMSRMTKPVISAIEGACFGGGLELALACHLRFAADNAFLGLPELGLGLLPGLGGIHRLIRVIGEAKALEMILLGDLVSAEKALEMGLVHRVFPRKALMERVNLLIRTILSVPQQAIEETLSLIISSRPQQEPVWIDQASEGFLRLLSSSTIVRKPEQKE